jgi:hypothetical protein
MEGLVVESTGRLTWMFALFAVLLVPEASSTSPAD